MQEQVLDIPEQAVITRDNATVAVDGIVYYRVMDPAKAAYAVQDLGIALTALAMTNIRAVIGEMELDATLSGRERINSSLLAILDGATDPWGVKVSRVEIRKIEPPENLIRAMNLQMTAERERRGQAADFADELLVAGFANSNPQGSLVGILSRVGAPVVKRLVMDRPTILPDKCTRCGQCVRACPLEEPAVQQKKKRQVPDYDYGRCIRCYCCQEVCPAGAITVRRPLLGRLLPH